MKLFYAIFTLVLLLSNINAWSCAGIQLKSKDSSVINGRTVEFGLNLDINGLVIPRNDTFSRHENI